MWCRVTALGLVPRWTGSKEGKGGWTLKEERDAENLLCCPIHCQQHQVFPFLLTPKFRIWPYINLFFCLKSKWMLCFVCLSVLFWNLIRFMMGSIQLLPVCVICSGQIPISNGSYFKVIFKLILPCICPNVLAGQRVHLSWLSFSSLDSNHHRQ